MKKSFLSLILILFTLSVFPQSLLWKVTGKDLKEPSYLYGSIHIQDQRVFSFDTTVLTALYSCDAFAMEILMDEIDAADAKAFTYMPKGKLLSEMMSESDFHKLDSVCKKKIHTSAYLLNTIKPFFVMSLLQQSEFSQDQEDALDIFFLKKAREANKFCYGVEKYSTQMGAIDAIKLKDQVAMLLQAINDTTTTESGESMTDGLLDAYLSFNLDTMLVMSNDPSMPKKFNKIFLVDRNVGMANNFEKIALEHTLFCVVGAAHLGGDKGVIALLRKKGYTVEPVKFEWK